jgi:hypothetical protein
MGTELANEPDESADRPPAPGISAAATAPTGGGGGLDATGLEATPKGAGND